MEWSDAWIFVNSATSCWNSGILLRFHSPPVNIVSHCLAECAKAGCTLLSHYFHLRLCVVLWRVCTSHASHPQHRNNKIHSFSLCYPAIISVLPRSGLFPPYWAWDWHCCHELICHYFSLPLYWVSAGSDAYSQCLQRHCGGVSNRINLNLLVTLQFLSYEYTSLKTAHGSIEWLESPILELS